MKVIVSDPISDEGLKIFRKNGIEIIDAVESEQSKTTKEVNLTFIKYKKDGSENGNN